MPLLRKGTITRRFWKPDPASKVAESSTPYATGWGVQRKVFYGSRFFVFYHNGTGHRYKSSLDGKKWSAEHWFASYPLGPWCGGIDVLLNPDGATVHAQLTYFNGSYGDYRYRKGTLADETISWLDFRSRGWLNQRPIVGNICLTPEPIIHTVSHWDRANTLRHFRIPPPDYDVPPPDVIPVTDYSDALTWDASSGGSQVVPYESSGNCRAMLLIKKGDDNVLYYTLLYDDSLTTPLTSLGVILSAGFSSFSASSPVISAGDPEKVHLVYIKNTGELCYEKYENDSWSSEIVLVESGASYPVIACGNSGRLYVFYVKAGKIWLKKYDGAEWLAEEQPFPGHGYNSPAYLSSNQNVQDGKICLVWTEGTASPYKVWFCSLEDS